METFAKWALITIGLFALMFGACYLAIMVVLSQITNSVEESFNDSFNSSDTKFNWDESMLNN